MELSQAPLSAIALGSNPLESCTEDICRSLHAKFLADWFGVLACYHLAPRNNVRRISVASQDSNQ